MLLKLQKRPHCVWYPNLSKIKDEEGLNMVEQRINKPVCYNFQRDIVVLFLSLFVLYLGRIYQDMVNGEPFISNGHLHFCIVKLL